MTNGFLTPGASYRWTLMGQSMLRQPSGAERIPKQLLRGLNPFTHHHSNTSAAGRGWDWWLADGLPDIQRSRAVADVFHIGLYFGGTSDILGGATGATTYQRISDLDDLLVFDYTIAVPIPPAGNAIFDAGEETERQAHNTLMLANSHGFDQVVNLWATLDDPTDTTYWEVDQLHLNLAGCDLAASLLIPARDAAILAHMLTIGGEPVTIEGEPIYA